MKSIAVGALSVALLTFGWACGGDSSSDSPAGSSGAAGNSTAGSDAGGSDAGGSAGSEAGGSDTAGSGGSEAAGASGSEASGGSSGGLFACEGGQTIQPGLNQNWMAGGKARKFFADFPKDTSKPLAVVFLFHGYGDTATNFKNFGPSPDSDPDFPFVLITPEDTDLQPFSSPQGLDWALFSGKSDAPNLEASLFEAVTGCLSSGFTVDSSRIYVMGFSAGAILSNMLASRYQGKIAASLAFSGAWFNDPEQIKGINTLGFKVDFAWDALTPPKGGLAMITHGGASDTFGAGGQQVIDFESCAQKAKPFLLGAGWSYIDCSHNNGHQPHPEISKQLIVKYFKDHRAGQPSPYAGGKLPADFPSSCTLNEPLRPGTRWVLAWVYG